MQVNSEVIYVHSRHTTNTIPSANTDKTAHSTNERQNGRQIQIAPAILWNLLHFTFNGWFQCGQVSLPVLHKQKLIS
jgi:hypothetical protein